MKKYLLFLMIAASLAFTACSTPDKGAAGTQGVEQTAPTEEPTLENGLPVSKQPDPNLPELDSVIIYAPDDSGELKGQMDAVDKLSEQALLDKLVEYGVLKEGVHFVSLDTQDAEGTSEEAGPGAGGPGASETETAKTGTLTLSGVAAGDSGISEDEAREAVIRTFAENYNLIDVTLQEQ